MGNLYALHFSPTGSTGRITMRIAEGIGPVAAAVDLTTGAPLPDLGPGDIAVVGVPVFGGRVPLPAVTRLDSLDGKGARAVIVVVYGNRHYDDALAESYDLLTGRGFAVLGAGAFIAQHSIADVAGTGRPTESDLADIDAFAAAVKLKASGAAEPMEPGELPGNRPYKERGGAGRPIDVADTCIACGLCAERCPVGAIPAENTGTTDLDRCFGCMRCIHICPVKARALPAPVREQLTGFLGGFSEPRANETYL